MKRHQRSLLCCAVPGPCAGKEKIRSPLPAKLDPLELEQLAAVTRLSPVEVAGLYKTFRKTASPDARMSVESFRSTLGILGLSQNSFLADALFRVFTGGRESQDLTYREFIQHLAIMLKGDEDEKLALSFNLALTGPGINEDGTYAGGGQQEELESWRGTGVEGVGGGTIELGGEQSLQGEEDSPRGGASATFKKESSGGQSPSSSKEMGTKSRGTGRRGGVSVVEERRNIIARLASSRGGEEEEQLDFDVRATDMLHKKIRDAKARGITIEQFRELIRAIDATINSLLPASYQKQVSEEMVCGLGEGGVIFL